MFILDDYVAEHIQNIISLPPKEFLTLNKANNNNNNNNNNNIY
jgi:hypothetical protein